LPGVRRVEDPYSMDDHDQAPERTLLEWAQVLCPDTPRKRLKQWIAAGRFYLDGKAVSQAGLRMPDPGDSLALGAPDSSVASWEHRKKVHPKLTVLYLDESLAIVDKAAGLLSVPAEEQAGKSALDLLGDYLNDPRGDAQRKRLFGGPGLVRPLPVHRLDQYTSGLLCLALNEEARRALIDQLQRYELLREYTAFADGRPRAPSGTWRHWLKLDAREYRQQLFQEPVEGAVEAVTHFTVEREFEQHRACRLGIRLETGLKHQIRIQAAAEGLPLIGDRHYHPGTIKAMQRKGAPLPYGFKRQALHAARIGLLHPRDGRRLDFESRLPADLLALQKRLS